MNEPMPMEPPDDPQREASFWRFHDEVQRELFEEGSDAYEAWLHEVVSHPVINPLFDQYCDQLFAGDTEKCWKKTAIAWEVLFLESMPGNFLDDWVAERAQAILDANEYE